MQPQSGQAKSAPTPTGSIFLRLLLNKYFTGKQDALAKLMPKEDWEALSATLTAQKEPELLLFIPNQWLTSVDISWLAPTLKSLPPELQKSYLKAFPKELGEILGDRALPEETADTAPVSEPVREFLLSMLHTLWNEKEVLPKELLASWELSPLLKMSRQEILEIIDLLSMYDLVEEMRHIVDKRLLQSILQHLSNSQQHYLRILLRQKSRPQASNLSVRELLKEEKKFPQLLHKFGLQRLALALSGADDDFNWHLLHTLDTSRAKFLTGIIQKQEVVNQSHQARLQVQHIIQFLKTETTP